MIALLVADGRLISGANMNSLKLGVAGSRSLGSSSEISKHWGM